MFQMVIEPNDPNRGYLPPSWNFHQSPGMTVWATAMDIADRENVTVLRIFDDQGRNVPLGK